MLDVCWMYAGCTLDVCWVRTQPKTLHVPEWFSTFPVAAVEKGDKMFFWPLCLSFYGGRPKEEEQPPQQLPSSNTLGPSCILYFPFMLFILFILLIVAVQTNSSPPVTNQFFSTKFPQSNCLFVSLEILWLNSSFSRLWKSALNQSGHKSQIPMSSDMVNLECGVIRGASCRPLPQSPRRPNTLDQLVR